MFEVQEIKTDAPEIEYVLNCVLEYAVGDEGGLMSFFDSKDGTPVDKTPMVEDFGDVAPFLWICGKREYAQQEFESVLKILTADILHVNPRRSHPWMVRTYDWTDLLLGLLDYYEISGEKPALDMAEKILDCWNMFFYRKHSVSGRGIIFHDKLYALPFSSLVDVGMFPELLLKLSKFCGGESKKKIQERAKAMLWHWDQTELCKETGLFPDSIVSQNCLSAFAEKATSVVLRQYGADSSVTLFKHNTNALASVLDVWKHTNDPTYLEIIRRWEDGCRNHLLTPENMVIMRWHKRKGVLQGPTDHNFQVVDLMCDIAHETKEERYLDLAQDVAGAWIKAQSPIGFMQHQIEGGRSEYAMSDSQTDFAIALLKLAALTGNEDYACAAETILGAIKKYMYLPCGMATWVNVNTGEPISTVCKTKFLTLSLKAWLAFNNRERIYQDEQFTNILSDR